MFRPGRSRHRPDRGLSSSAADSSRANPSRDGDAKPGISRYGRPPGYRGTGDIDRLKGVKREGEPGSLHLGADASRIDGSHSRRRDALGLTDDSPPQGSGLSGHAGSLGPRQLRSCHRGWPALEVIGSLWDLTYVGRDRRATGGLVVSDIGHRPGRRHPMTTPHAATHERCGSGGCAIIERLVDCANRPGRLGYMFWRPRWVCSITGIAAMSPSS
jgi:hypothetical protein